MLLAIDVGNTSTTFGGFDGEKLLKTWRSPTHNLQLKTCLPPACRTGRAGKAYNLQPDEVIICSVVPDLDQRLKTKVHRLFGINPFFVTAENIPGIRMKVKKRNEVGADRVVNALAAYKLYGAPAIVIDFGTATTFDVISAKGEYWGGAIAPGINLARDALYHQTAKLPKVEIKAPRKVIGTDTVSAMQSGLVYGYVAMVEGMLQRIKCQMSNDKCQMKVIATGGYAPLICKYTNMVDCVDQDLTLKGLRLAGQNLPR